MTYSGFKEAMDSGLHQVLMYNKAGQLVSLNLDSVRSAMVDQDNSTTYSIALSDAPGTPCLSRATHKTSPHTLTFYRTQPHTQPAGENSWPLSHFEFLTLANNSTGAFDCGDVQDLLAFLSWAQFNDKASEVAQNEGYVPLSNHFRKRYAPHTRARRTRRIHRLMFRFRVFDSLYNITCHGKRAFNTAVLLGGGGSSPTYPSTPLHPPHSQPQSVCVVCGVLRVRLCGGGACALVCATVRLCACAVGSVTERLPTEWASAFESSTFLLKYFASTDAQALTDSLELNVDFGATSSCTPLCVHPRHRTRSVTTDTEHDATRPTTRPALFGRRRQAR
jgi:hypothetical protein